MIVVQDSLKKNPWFFIDCMTRVGNVRMANAYDTLETVIFNHIVIYIYSYN
jgi:hypothetical protein